MWVCTACTLENENDAYLSCAVCGTTRAPENEAAEDSRDAADSLEAAEDSRDAADSLDAAEDSRKRQREETAPAPRRPTFDLAQLGKRPRAAPTVPAPPPTASPRAPSRPSFDLGRLRSLPARPCTVRDGDAPPRSVADAEVPSVAPAHIVRRVLPPALADALLRKLLADGDWHRGTWTVGGKTSVNARRTRSFRIRMTGGGEFEALGGGADAQAREENGSSRARGYAACPELLEAARFVTAAAREVAPRSWKDNWEPTVAFGNRYDGGQEHVGYHSDFLMTMGPRPIIAGLSLGATREFRLRREATDYAPSRVVCMPAEHNSLIVMSRDCQEEWKHSVAKTSSVPFHAVAGETRFSLTFRRNRPEFSQSATRNCNCGKPAALKCAKGRYYYTCCMAGGDASQKCSYYARSAVAQQEADRLRAIDESG
ncbi:unnamed protein product [Pelagomonas calceolata]|uniref:Fe2OG dioxygenase domain-containing protein n=1 Tax=Pelagomonas calceolata TaxID=35677 RepID=A0A8J2WXP9_9STRA|nr:unnamed protein product [Pelagomonas calceolata]